MKILSLAFCMFALALGGTASAETHNATPQKMRANETAGTRHQANYAPMSQTTPGKTVRASEFLGANIHNPKGETIAEINDLVLDPVDGKIRYAAVTYGGFLGLGDKMFAVPWSAIECRPNPQERDEHILSMNVTEKQLEGAQGFDQDHWPNFADKDFVNELNKRYEVESPQKRGEEYQHVNE